MNESIFPSIVPNQRIIKVKFLPPTNIKGDRIKITESRFERTDSVIIPYSYEFNDAVEIAIDYLTKKGINIIARGVTNNESILVSDSWARGEKEFISIK